MSNIAGEAALGQYSKVCGRRGEPFLVLGPNKITCIALILGVNIVSIFILVVLSKYEDAYLFFMVNLVILIYIDIVWIATGVLNPGIVLKSKFQQYNCQHCRESIPLTEEQIGIREHCRICGVCVQDRHHHCSVVGGCVGQGNKLCYYFFLLALILWCVDIISTAPYLYYLH